MYYSKTNRILIYLIAITLLLIALLMLVLAVYEVAYGDGSFSYSFGGVGAKYKKSDVLRDGICYVDMDRIAEMYSMTSDKVDSEIKYALNGTYIIFENMSDTASVNSVAEIKMNGKAYVDKNGCFIPLDSIARFLSSVTVDVDGRDVNISSDKESKDVYIVSSEGIRVEYENDISQYIEYIKTNDENSLILANKKEILGQNYVPDALAEIPSEYRVSSTLKLCLDAEKALEAMMLDARTAGITDLYVTSAYRSYQYQQGLFESYVNKEIQNGLSRDEAEEEVLKYSAKAGTSEHQTGLCVDFTTASIGGVVEEIFETTAAYDWLSENSWKYGFILRYPKDKVETTGYSYEPWHYRFVGFEAAAKIYQTGVCFEEYLELIN